MLWSEKRHMISSSQHIVVFLPFLFFSLLLSREGFGISFFWKSDNTELGHFSTRSNLVFF